MPIKIKIFISFLGLVAVSLAYLGLKNLKIDSNIKPNQANINAPLERDADWDNDGLTNREESYWNTDPNNPDTDGDGYLDGEEVASGHDPLKPGPDDKLPAPEDLNITDKVSALMAAGYYAGDLSTDTEPEVYNKALADISTEMILDGIQTLTPNDIDVAKIIFSSDSKSAQETYLNVVGTIIQVDLWGQLVNEPRVAGIKFSEFFTENSQRVSDGERYFTDNTNHYQQVLDKLNSTPVPPSWLDIHKQILSNVQTLIINHKALSQTNEDPLKSVLAMSNLISVYQDIQPTLINLTRKIKENNLNPPNGQLWSLVNSLTSGF
ncbi:MAG: hypothetical protein HYX22_01375 [Candidatus Yanofskybacteria bacterium]|nr:hypothetical protein [Candidatus Yanofskybacteria bacterium]